MKQKTKLSLFVIVFMSFALGFFSLAAAKNDNASEDKSNKSSSQTQKKKKIKRATLKVYKQPNKETGETHANIHKDKVREVVDVLDEVSKQEKKSGNEIVSAQIDQVVAIEEQNQGGTADAISELESRNKVKTFLVGVGYKNLGQLRSSLMHNRNEIRKLTRALNLVTDTGNITAGTGSQVSIQAQLETLMQERERIKTIISENENVFSLFGWVSKFLANYEEKPINDAEENELTEEVEDAINNTPDTTITTPSIPTTTAPSATTTTL